MIRRQGPRIFRSLIFWALLAGLLFAVYVGVYATGDLRGTRGLPVESVTVLDVRNHSSDLAGCGKTTDPQDLRIESANPPTGLPAVFWVPRACLSGLVEKGDTVPLVRKVENGEVVRYYIDPTLTYSEASRDALGAFAAMSAGLFIVLWVGRQVRRVLMRRFGLPQ